MAEEFIKAMIWSFSGALVTIGISSVGIIFKIWLDLRSARKAIDAAFIKIRALEEK